MKTTATRNPLKTEVAREMCTEFGMYMTQNSGFESIKTKLLDFTEHKLQRFISNVYDPQQLNALNELMLNYKRGNVAIAWKRGAPIFIKVTQEK